MITSFLLRQNATVYSLEKFREKVKSHDHFLTTVLKGRKHFVRNTIRASLDSLGIAISSLGSAGAAPAIPEVRMTSTKVMNGDKGDSQTGS